MHCTYIQIMVYYIGRLPIVHVIFVIRHGKLWCTKYFKYSYILVHEIICEDLMKITQIIVEIWPHLFLWISLKIAKLHYKHYYYLCMVEDVALNCHHTKFGNNCKTQCRNMDKIVKKLNWRLKPALQFKDRIRRQNKLKYFLY